MSKEPSEADPPERFWANRRTYCGREVGSLGGAYTLLVRKTKRAVHIAPQRVSCPFCGAQRNGPCKTASGNNLRRDLLIEGVQVALVHVERMLKATKMDRPPLYDDRLPAAPEPR